MWSLPIPAGSLHFSGTEVATRPPSFPSHSIRGRSPRTGVPPPAKPFPRVGKRSPSRLSSAPREVCAYSIGAEATTCRASRLLFHFGRRLVWLGEIDSEGLSGGCEHSAG